ncbi:MAG: HAD family phosphatase [Acidobacteria bacterium]|nr:HAD family phosphatase [Acidobacteriota bacterium]
MLRAILFDFNGVLVDDEPLHFELFGKVLADEGIELSKEDYYEHYLGFDDRGAFEAIFGRLGRSLDIGHLMRLITRKSAYYQRVIHEKGYPFFPGAVDLVRDCAAADLMLGVVSGALREEVEGALRQENLLAHFKVLVTADEVQRSKPDPEGYQLGLEGLNSRPPLPGRLIHPHEALAIEDSPAGIEAAATLGMTTLAVAQTYGAGQLSGADVVVGSVAELNAERLCELYDCLG